MQGLTLHEEFDSARKLLEHRRRELIAAQSYFNQAQEQYNKVADRIVDEYLPKGPVK